MLLRLLGIVCGIFFLSMGASANSENPEILKDIFRPYLATSDLNVELAAQLTPQLYPKGVEITQAQCEQIELRISQNYSLHRYWTFESGRPGVKLCPDIRSDLFDGDYILVPTLKYSLAQGPVENLLHVPGTSVLSIEYMLSNLLVKVSRQYILDAQSKMIQFVESRQEGDFPFWSIASAMDSEGNILSRTAKNWKNPNEPYLWKNTASFTPADANAPFAYRHVQNNGKGAEVENRTYRMPYGAKWDAYEVSPYTREGGVYKVGDDLTTWLESQAALSHFSSATQSCDQGYIGFDAKGEYFRVFGNQDCAKELDVSSSRI